MRVCDRTGNQPTLSRELGEGTGQGYSKEEMCRLILEVGFGERDVGRGHRRVRA